MKKQNYFYLLILAAFLCSISFFSVSAQCGGCESRDLCYGFGDTVNLSGINYYCDIDGSLIAQKPENASCMNDFECLTGFCLDDACTDLYALIRQNEELAGQINVSNLSAPCSASPGCLNLASIANGNKVSGMCLQNYFCYQCNTNYVWNVSSSACESKACDGDAGCKNTTSIANATNITGRCQEGYTCFDCNAHYRWSSSEEECFYYTPTSAQTPKTVSISSDVLKRNYRNDFIIDDKIKFYFLSLEHSIKILDIGRSNVEVEVRSLPQTITLYEDEREEVDLDGDGTYDLFVKLNGIDEYESIDMTIGLIEALPVQTTTQQTTTQTQQPGVQQPRVIPTQGTGEEAGKSGFFWIIISVLVILAIAVIGAIVYLLSKKSGEQIAMQSQMSNTNFGNLPSQPKSL